MDIMDIVIPLNMLKRFITATTQKKREKEKNKNYVAAYYFNEKITIKAHFIINILLTDRLILIVLVKESPNSFKSTPNN